MTILFWRPKVRQIIIFIALFALLVSCIPFDVSKGTRPVDDVPKPSLLLPLTPTTQKLETSKFEIKMICPTDRIRNFSNIGIPANLQLVVMGPIEKPKTNPDGAYSLLSPDSSEPRLIQSVTPPIGLENHAYSISPDGSWILFYRDETSSSKTKDIVVSSLDGTRQVPITQFINSNQSVTWLSNGNKLVVWGDPNAKSDDPYDWNEAIPLAVIDPVTWDAKHLEALPLSQERYPGMKMVFENESNFYILYSYGGMPFDEFVLYSYATKSNNQVFQWLTGIDTLFFDSTFFSIQDNTFSVFIEKSYGLDIATGMRLEDIKRTATYDQMMKKIALPADVLPSKVLNWNLEKDSILFFGEESLGDTVSYKLFSLDVNNKVINDYCFEMSENFSRIYLSPDGSFAAFSSPKETSSRVTILNLETGYLDILENYEIIGWGQK